MLISCGLENMINKSAMIKSSSLCIFTPWFVYLQNWFLRILNFIITWHTILQTENETIEIEHSRRWYSPGNVETSVCYKTMLNNADWHLCMNWKNCLITLIDIYVWTDYAERNIFRNTERVVKILNSNIRRPWRQLIDKRQRQIHVQVYENRQTYRQTHIGKKQGISQERGHLPLRSAMLLNRKWSCIAIT